MQVANKRTKLSATITVTAYVWALVLPTLGSSVTAQATPGLEPAEVYRILGLDNVNAVTNARDRITLGDSHDVDAPQVAGQPSELDERSPLSAALMASVGAAGTQFNESTLFADWDGREDLTADRGSKTIGFGVPWTRNAISAHTVANGFNENIFYTGDSSGIVLVNVDTNPGSGPGPNGHTVDDFTFINLPTVLNAFGTLLSDTQVVVTGVCVSPVVDLTAWPNVNGAFTPFLNQIGESLIVTYTDTGGGLRLAANNQIVRSGVLAFPIADTVSPAAVPPGVLSDAGFPVTVGGGFGVAFSTFSNLAGCAVDDDGNVYFQQVDLQQFSGANIVKITRAGTNQDRAMATSGFMTITTLNPAGGLYGSSSGPVSQVNRLTNYSGTSSAFGNITALAAGPGNTLYAAMASSADAGLNGGLFQNPAALGPTPSMVVSFADAIGTFSPSADVVVPDGFADAVGPGAAVPGVNNFKTFVHGNGPDRRGSAAVFGTVADTLKVDLQIDYTIFSGLAVNEDRQLFVVHGGTPAGVGRDPSAGFGEIQVYPDDSPADRRGDYIDLRGNVLPNPPASGGNVGDGDSDRFDHIFALAPIDVRTVTPTGLAGLSRGFLRYTNRLAPNPISPGVTLGQTARVQGDDASTGPIFFEGLDPGHQVAGGDDQNTPFRGDDSDGGGFPAIAGPLAGGFEFNFGVTVGVCTAPWNAFFLNSNGNLTFNIGDTTSPGATATDAFLTGPGRIAPAWRNFNPDARQPGAFHHFPVQALGFAGVNHFKVRWINVARAGAGAVASRNTFSVSLFDDGVAIDENATQALNPANPIGNNAVAFDRQEGPTDTRFIAGPTGLAPSSPRAEGQAPFRFEYGSMDSAIDLNAGGNAVVTGYSIGGQLPGAAAEINLSEVGRTAIIGSGALAEVALFETFLNNDFDLRYEGNDAASATPAGQPNPNREVLAFFGRACAPATLALVAAVVGSGTVTSPGISCPGDCSEFLPSGTVANLTATPAAGFVFSSFIGCDSVAANVCTVTMNAVRLVTAVFTAAPAPLVPSLNQASFTTGQTMVLSVTLNPALAGPGPVDAYILLDTPTLGTFSLLLGPTVVPGQVPIVTNFTPIPFSGPVLTIPLPAIPAGTYQWRAFLTQAGTGTVIGTAGVATFTFTP
jgi:Divergent InlB B-repeat domain